MVDPDAYWCCHGNIDHRLNKFVSLNHTVLGKLKVKSDIYSHDMWHSPQILAKCKTCCIPWKMHCKFQFPYLDQVTMNSFRTIIKTVYKPQWSNTGFFFYWNLIVLRIWKIYNIFNSSEWLLSGFQVGNTFLMAFVTAYQDFLWPHVTILFLRYFWYTRNLAIVVLKAFWSKIKHLCLLRKCNKNEMLKPSVKLWVFKLILVMILWESKSK